MIQSLQDKITEAAKFIAKRWVSGELEFQLPDSLKPASLNEGYEIQAELLRQLKASPNGWKLAVASDNQVAQSNLDRGLVGRLLSERSYPSGAHIDTPISGALTIECEIGLRLARDILPTESVTIDNDLIDAVTFNFEIVRSRFVDRRAIGWPSFVADDAAYEAIVIGEPLATQITDELLSKFQNECAVSLDGTTVSSALTGKDGIHPLTSLRYLIEHAREHNLQLFKGQMITTGAFCKPFDIADRGHKISFAYPNYSLSFTV